MNVIAVIEQDDGIFRMLSHLGLVPAEELVYVPVFDDLLFPEAA